MKKKTRQTDRHVEAVLAALAVLDSFLTKPDQTMIEIMKATGFTRNRVTRLTGTLVHRGYLTVDPGAGIFSTGPQMYALGKVFERNRAMLSLVRPILKEIVLKTGESASLYGREGSHRVVLAREEGTHEIRHAIAEGQRMDLHAGAAGKVLLAYLSEDVVETLLRKAGLPTRTEATISDKTLLLRELDEIRSRGYAISLGERLSDVCAMAAPVRDSGNELVGALCLSGPISRLTLQVRSHCMQVLLAAATKFSMQLGWRPAGP